ncbi:uncharacterized, partial [Tachysurus ichikawai]
AAQLGRAALAGARQASCRPVRPADE